MGGTLGCHRSLPAADPAEQQQRGRKFSATCSFAHSQAPSLSYSSPARLDVNAASEEELMTLPGVTRTVARAMVEHRARIGGFRRVEDVALVSGVGAAMLHRIRPEICVSGRGSERHEHRRHPSVTHAGTPGYYPNSPGSCRCTCLHLPPGGPPQIPSDRPHREPPPCARDGKPVIRVATWDLQRCSSDKANNPGVKEVVCRTLLERDIKLLAVQDLANREALDKFCAELNQHTLSSVCNWEGPRGVWKCAASEKPTGESSTGPEYSGFLWDASAGVHLEETLVLDGVVANGNGNGNGSDAQPKAFLGRFYVGSSDLTVVNVHLKAPAQQKQQNGRSHKSEQRKAPRLSPAVKETLKGVKNVVVVGGFGLPPDSAEFESLKKEKLSALVSSSIYTNISTRSPQGSSCVDNIWVSRSIKKIYAGHCSVVREGLTNPWIPDNWSWGGVASEHCPVVAEFYTTYVNEKTPKEPPHNGNSVAAVERGDVTPKHER
ncbi:endonuclease/exonuclease/phosphatase family domain-containing protein 1 [Trichomycterus rosablanca]|uniref:endonuclease/exonuclease/phosphatase family domain-containing protein 1 n=1 Tax=Trichomycterus rosablanca TaxID=2290929 RepID=UPI002F35285E